MTMFTLHSELILFIEQGRGYSLNKIMKEMGGT